MAQLLLGLDVGGSSIKAGIVDIEARRLVGELISAPTPQPSTPSGLMSVLQQLSERLPNGQGSIGVAFPSVVKRGKVRTAANIHHSWIGTDAVALAAKVLGRPAECLNDADAAGFAEMRWGAGKDEAGMVFMLTFGTGIGEVSTLNQLNAALAADNLQASINTTGQISIATTNNAASSTIGAVTTTGRSDCKV